MFVDVFCIYIQYFIFLFFLYLDLNSENIYMNRAWWMQQQETLGSIQIMSFHSTLINFIWFSTNILLSVIWKLLYWLAMWIGWLVSVCFEFVIKGSSYLIYILFILSMLFALLFNVINLMATYCCCWRSCCLLIFSLHFVVRFCFLFIFIHIINFHSFLFILLSVIITLLFTLPVIISTFLLIYFYCFFIIAVII